MKLEKQLQKENKKRMLESIKRINDYASAKEAVKNSWYFKSVLTKKEFNNIEALNEKEALKVLKNAIIRDYTKELQKDLKRLENIKNVDFKECHYGVCSIDWIKNRTWGNCPRGEYRNGHNYQEFKSVTGYGYDKLSTLTANMLNSDIYLISYVANYIEKHAINNENIRERLGYGIRISSGLPCFDGGVGVDCHKRILQKLGFKVTHNATRSSDYIEYTK